MHRDTHSASIQLPIIIIIIIRQREYSFVQSWLFTIDCMQIGSNGNSTATICVTLFALEVHLHCTQHRASLPIWVTAMVAMHTQFREVWTSSSSLLL